MLGIIVLIFFQIIGAGWLAWTVMRVFERKGYVYSSSFLESDQLLYLGGIAIFASIFAWAIGILASEIIKDVEKPSKNTLVTSLFVSAIVIVLLVLPIFRPYIGPFLDQYVGHGLQNFHLVVLATVLGYHLSK